MFGSGGKVLAGILAAVVLWFIIAPVLVTGINATYGRTGTGLSGDTGRAANGGAAKAGARGERQTEDFLCPFADRAAVLHDLRAPITGFNANIDHVIVSGRRVLIPDTKVWKPRLYWTFAGVNRRGFEGTDHRSGSWACSVGSAVARATTAMWASGSMTAASSSQNHQCRERG